jgi:class 3 adenylate cyclase
VLLAQHREDVERLLASANGRLIKSTGDGFLATFDQPAAAVRSAAAIAAAAGRIGLQVRAGVHTGEVELAEDDLRGVTVHMAARVMAVADPDQVLVSSTTRELVIGSGLSFEEKGSYELKGIEGARTLHALRG